MGIKIGKLIRIRSLGSYLGSLRSRLMLYALFGCVHVAVYGFVGLLARFSSNIAKSLQTHAFAVLYKDLANNPTKPKLNMHDETHQCIS